MNESHPKTCPSCGGNTGPGQTTFTAELGFGVVVVRHVPATVCEECGEEWIARAAAANVETLVNQARGRHAEVEVVAYS